MSLAGDIERMTVPQDFTKLCNAVLGADHGNDFLPIDDDRPDRGNDGYLKSEKRVFAGHCFKRIQNQSIDQFIRNKMVGDLGKAIALREQDLWEIDAWTFLSNYPIPEEIGQLVNALGAKAGLDVSWRGPQQLAEGLQRHQYLLEQFPTLHATEIESRLQEIQRTLEGGRTEEAQPSARSEFDLTTIPATMEHRRAFAAERPSGWEYFVYAGALTEGKQKLERKWDDEQLAVTRGDRKRIADPHDARHHVADQFRVVSAILEDLMRSLQAEAQERAFGAPGEPGDLARIENLAHQVVRVYEDLMDWSAGLRAVVIPEEYEPLRDITARYARLPMERIRAFIDELATQTLRVPGHVAADTGEVLEIRLELVLEVDPALSDELDAELLRLERML